MLAVLAKCTVEATRLMFISANQVPAYFTDFARLKSEIPAVGSYIPVGLPIHPYIIL
jgi:hypothetical protein